MLNLQEKYDQETKGKLSRVGLVAGMIVLASDDHKQMSSKWKASK